MIEIKRVPNAALEPRPPSHMSLSTPHLSSSYVGAVDYPSNERAVLRGPPVRVRSIGSRIIPIHALESNFFSLVTATVSTTAAAVAPPF